MIKTRRSLLIVIVAGLICLECAGQIKPSYGIPYTKNERPFFQIDSNRNVAKSIVFENFRLDLKIVDNEPEFRDTNLSKIGQGIFEEKILLEVFDFPKGDQIPFTKIESYSAYFKFIDGIDVSYLFYNSRRFVQLRNRFYDFNINTLKITESNEFGKLVQETTLLNTENYIFNEVVDFVNIKDRCLLLACNCSLEGDNRKYNRGRILLLSLDSMNIIQDVWTENPIVNAFHTRRQLHVICEQNDGKLYRLVYEL